MQGDRISMSQRERDVLKVMSLVLSGKRTQIEATRPCAVYPTLGRSGRTPVEPCLPEGEPPAAPVRSTARRIPQNAAGVQRPIIRGVMPPLPVLEEDISNGRNMRTFLLSVDTHLVSALTHRKVGNILPAFVNDDSR